MNEIEIIKMIQKLKESSLKTHMNNLIEEKMQNKQEIKKREKEIKVKYKQFLSKELEEYDFKILKMEKRSFLLQNYNISQMSNSKYNQNKPQLKNEQLSESFNNNNNNNQNILIKSQSNHSNFGIDDKYQVNNKEIKIEEISCDNKEKEFNQFLIEHKLKYINLPLKL